MDLYNSKLNIQEEFEQISILKTRFEQNPNRHIGLKWNAIEAKLESNPDKILSMYKMEISGGEPDVVGFDAQTVEYIFFDCSAESPKGRRSICYDRMAWDTRKENKPKNNAMDMAAEIGIEILNESQYLELQTFGEYDTKTSSWIVTPAEIRKLGGALFGDCRYNTVFFYHNGAESYYAARGFRGTLRT